MRLRLITLLMLLLASQLPQPAGAQQVRYDWLGLVAKEGVLVNLPGGYKLQAKIELIGGVSTYAVVAQVY
ncbi:MAG: hypothetical protein BA066_07820, partial [Candidatus Korarchaeota archaeon NZ13-K]